MNASSFNIPAGGISTLLDQRAPCRANVRAGEAAIELDKVPAKCAVYLIAGEGDTPLLLATVGNLRAALERRLADVPAELKTKRIPYRELCRAVHYRIVHSPFAANWWYYQTAKTLFPETYREMVSWRRAWFVGVDAPAPFPRFRKTQDLDEPATRYAGPIADKHAAGKVIEAVEDLFDLCRYYQILVQAPCGRACAYKEMGKCPAPCDGSETIESYRERIHAASDFLGGGYEPWRNVQEAAMRQSAAKLEFEKAAKIKAKLQLAQVMERGDLTHINHLEQFSLLSLQPGKGRRWVEPYVIHGGAIDSADQVEQKQLATAIPHWIQRCQKLAERPIAAPLNRQATEVIGLVCHHLFRGNGDSGLYLPTHAIASGKIDANAIERAAVLLLERRIPPKPMAEQSSDGTTGEKLAEAAVDTAGAADAH